MYEYNQSRGNQGAKPARKLIGSYFGEKILIYAPLLKWYLDHGMEITKTYSFIKASSHKAFAPFMEAVSSARREGDVYKSKAMIAEMMKLVGNSAFGRSGMDMSKHTGIKCESDDKKIEAKIEHFTFHGLEELNDACEINMKKRSTTTASTSTSIVPTFSIKKWTLIALTSLSVVRIRFKTIKPELREYFKQHKYDWFPRDYNIKVAKFDRRTPGLFKDEWSGDAMVSLSSKNYICYLPDEQYKVKVSAKGAQQGHGRNEDVLNPEGFETVVRDRITLQGNNKGFRISNL
ncbi:hypothetical protein PC110_g8925 [Phytophthora cactorum]|uniref:DNA-directed DNA polymerase n=1 Tax=Phytophthora cactorum TaxID=29920 RepID=A0A329SDA1_9STRA|nr:hypothetical protein PC110_g8925 [Phytophthora cactorum]